MKKLLLLMLVLLGGVMQMNAQITESGKIKVYFNNPNGTWAQNKFKIFIKDCTNGDTWPGVDVTNNVATINGVTYYYREVDTSTHGTSFTAIFVNCKEDNTALSQTTDVKNIKGDSFYTLLDTWDSGNRNWLPILQYYFTKTDGTETILMNTSDRTTWNVSYDHSGENCYFVIANNYAFTTNGAIDWNNQKDNICRNYPDTELGFSNVSNSSNIHNGWNEGSFYLSAEATYDLSVTFDAANSITPSSYTVSPYFTRTLPAAAQGYATFSSTYDVIPDANLTAVQYASAVNNSTGQITWENFPATGIKAGEGALLTGTAGETYKFTPASSAAAIGGNCLKAIDTKKQLSQTLDGNTNYILAKPGTEVGFYKVNNKGSWCGAGTAYLSVPSGTNSREFFTLEGETTGIANLNIDINDNFDANAPMYNLAGQRVSKSYKGVVIVNGKKMLNK